MRLNNKGFATTAIMYSILTLIIMLLLGSLAYLASRKRILDKLRKDTYNNVNQIIEANENGADYSYTGTYQVFTVKVPGYYKVELWGASGKSSQGGFGKGGYTSGYIYMNRGEKLYFYVGDNSNCSTGYTYNGGGCGEAVGGGATDVRYFGSTTPTSAQLAWDSDLGLNSRIMVAAGGGGGVYSNVTSTAVGHAGGLLGLTPANNLSTNLGKGGNQRFGGATGSAGNYAYETNMDGSFGKGGKQDGRASGGGSGYYGGGHGRHPGSSWSGGGGGSSFISGYAGVNAITSATSRTHTNNTKHYSGKYFLGGIMRAGDELVPTFDGKAQTIGNPNTGHAKILYVGNTLTRTDTRLNNVRYVKLCENGNTSNAANHIVEIQAIKDGVNLAKGKTVTGTSPESNNTTHSYTYITDGMIDNFTGGDGWGAPTNYANACVTIDLGNTYNLDEVAAWNYWPDARTYKTYILSVSSNNSSWTTLINNGGNETYHGKRVSAYVGDNSALFYYTAETQTFNAQSTGYYRIETWGASGGTSGTSIGGNGAYASGIIKLNKNDALYLYVGQKGPANATVTNVGGWNGGGYSGNNGGANSYGGGGATDARVTNGAWNDATSLRSRIMVAAGGGGGTSGTATRAGAGGGLIGVMGTTANSTYNNSTYLTLGGTQIAGGFGYQNNTTRNGQFGMGVQTNSSGWGGGGGAGYYGGGNGCGVTGSGGSSFISGYAGVNAVSSASNTAASNATKHYSGRYFYCGTMEANANTGDGKAKVTYLGSSLSQPRFTETYQRLEYIQSTGTQYIDTGYKASSNTGVEIDYQFTEVSTLQQRLFGANTTNSGYLNYHMYINGATAWAYSFIDGSGNWATTNVAADVYRHKIQFNIPVGQLKIDDILYNIASTTRTRKTETTMYIMNGAITGSPNAKMRLYGFKMYDCGELVRNMIPVKRISDNAIGLYDMVEDKFYANAGTGTFTAGPVIDLTNVRYVKDCTSGSSANASNHWVELQAIKDGVNLAKGKTATGITNNTGKPIVNITDGDLTTANYAEGGAAVPTCVTLDLGSSYNLDEIAVWHYWGDARVYNNHTLSVSNNNSTWRTLISSTERETSQGKRVSAYVN